MYRSGGWTACSETEQLILPELGVQFEGYYIRILYIEIEGVTEMKDQFAAHVHGAEKIGRTLKTLTGDLP